MSLITNGGSSCLKPDGIICFNFITILTGLISGKKFTMLYTETRLTSPEYLGNIAKNRETEVHFQDSSTGSWQVVVQHRSGNMIIISSDVTITEAFINQKIVQHRLILLKKYSKKQTITV